MKSLKKNNLFFAFLAAAFFAPVALAVVTVLDPGGSPVPNTTISITLPSGEIKEGETDDDGILFWWIDGKRTKVDELPALTSLSDGYSFTVRTGMSVGMKAGLGIAAAASAIAIAVNNDDGSSSQDSDPVTTDPQDPPMTDPPMGMLSVTPPSLFIERQVGDPCPVEVGVITVANTGGQTLDYTVSPSASDSPSFDYSDQGNSISANSSDSIMVNYTCANGDETGTVSQDISFDAGDAGVGATNVQVQSMATPVDPGMLQNEGPTEFVKIHVVGQSPCPDPYGVIHIANTGGMDINFSLAGESFIAADITSGMLAPGDRADISAVFPCSGFQNGSNIGQIVISSSDAGDSAMDTGTVTIPVDLTVNN